MLTDYDLYIESLCKRAKACPAFRWVGGMLVITPVKSDIRVTYRINVEPALIDGAHYPNVTDPATAGGLLSLIREAVGDPSVGIYAVDVFNQRQWVCAGISAVISRGATEAEALVFALEEASKTRAWGNEEPSMGFQLSDYPTEV
jgi:hypothetical protein